MKKISFNPANGLSILLAGVFLFNHPETEEVNEVSTNGTDFKSKMDEQQLKLGYVAGVLSEDKNLESAFHHGLVANYGNITEFQTQFDLKKIFDGNGPAVDRLLKEGESILNYKKSPAFIADLENHNSSSSDNTDSGLGDTDDVDNSETQKAQKPAAKDNKKKSADVKS